MRPAESRGLERLNSLVVAAPCHVPSSGAAALTSLAFSPAAPLTSDLVALLAARAPRLARLANVRVCFSASASPDACADALAVELCAQCKALCCVEIAAGGCALSLLCFCTTAAQPRN